MADTFSQSVIRLAVSVQRAVLLRAHCFVRHHFRARQGVHQIFCQALPSNFTHLRHIERLSTNIMYSEKTSFGEKVGDWFRHILSCCDREDEEESRPALQIVSSSSMTPRKRKPLTSHQQSGPTNFRREDISIPGLDPEQYVTPTHHTHVQEPKLIPPQTTLHPHQSHLRRAKTLRGPTTPPLLALRPLRLPHLAQNAHLRRIHHAALPGHAAVPWQPWRCAGQHDREGEAAFEED